MGIMKLSRSALLFSGGSRVCVVLLGAALELACEDYKSYYHPPPPYVPPAECRPIEPYQSDDEGAPLITLDGPSIVLLPLGSEYRDAGAHAQSADGADLSARIQVLGLEAIDVTEPGDYLIRYQVRDDAGLRATEASRIVRVHGETFARQTLRPFGTTERKVAYFEHLPTNFGVEPDTTYPLLIFNVGWGNDRQLDPALEEMWAADIAVVISRGQWDDARPFVVLTPQRCETELSGWEMLRLEQFIDYALLTYHIDPTRIYMAGFSDGGWLTWNYVFSHPDQLAAAVPMGAGGPLDQGCKAKHTPIWAFQGEDDVPLWATIATVDSINACSPDMRARLTFFPNTDHLGVEPLVLAPTGLGQGSPDVYEEDVYSWLLRFKK